MDNVTRLGGILTRDVELRYSKAGKPYARLNIRNERSYQAGGQQRTDKLFMGVVVFGNQAEQIGQLRAGTQVVVEGRLQSSSYEAKDGSGKRWVTDLIASNVDVVGGGAGQTADEPEYDEVPF